MAKKISGGSRPMCDPHFQIRFGATALIHPNSFTVRLIPMTAVPSQCNSPLINDDIKPTGWPEKFGKNLAPFLYVLT